MYVSIDIHVYHHVVRKMRSADMTAILKAIQASEGRLMAARDDLKQAIDEMTAEIAKDLSALSMAMSAEFQRVTDALAAMDSTDPVVTAITAQVQAMQASLHQGLSQAVDSLNAELPDIPPGP